MSSSPSAAGPGAPWWKSGVLYEIYPRSFADSDGDGIGDLQGIIDRLDHLEWLGIDGLWLSPVSPSPNADWGYDVADYCGVDPAYGTLATLDALVAEAGRRGIHVLLDLVPNHTSEAHPWFVEARSSRSSAQRDWYVWAEPGPDGSRPNNWVAQFGGPAWTLDEATDEFYLHNFTREQPDLNWWNPAVHRAFEEIMRFWLDRGLAGFRIDVCNMIVKDAGLRDNPPATEDDAVVEQLFGQRFAYNGNRPEVHEILQSWRTLADTYDPPRLLLGETDVHHLSMLPPYYGDGSDELHLAFNLAWLHSEFRADALRAVVEETERILPPGAQPVWTGSNLDTSRLATRWAQGNGELVRCVLLALLCLRGTPVLYQGDEIGLPDGAVTEEVLRDPVGRRYWPHAAGRDPERSPLPWHDGPGRGFTAPGVEPWLPMGTPPAINVASQRDDPGSVLTFTRDLIALRRRSPDLWGGSYDSLPSPPDTWVWRRGRGFAAALNLGDEARRIDGLAGSVAIGTDRRRDGEPVQEQLSLSPGEGVLIRLT
ncbi:MAG TPA: alpha-amylase family glycosyl hydrolase [Acidimicrobiales bacterium]|nr:alpha-amylase family glycosyl hydrolase [Acidimicrobiales bacterium]